MLAGEVTQLILSQFRIAASGEKPNAYYNMPDAIEKTAGADSALVPSERLLACAQAAANALVVAFVLMLVTVLLVPPASQLPPALALIIGLLPVHGGGLAAALFTLTESGRGRRLLELLELTRPRPGEAAFMVRGVTTALAWFYPLSLIVTLHMILFLKLGGLAPSRPMLQELLLTNPTPGFLLVATVGILVVAPVAEEILFRLVLHDTLLLVGRNTALVGTALAFAAVHVVPEQVPALFMLGLLLQVTRRRFQSLWPAIGLHAAYNALTLVFLFLALWLGLVKPA